jgi:hypothetical protein
MLVGVAWQTFHVEYDPFHGIYVPASPKGSNLQIFYRVKMLIKNIKGEGVYLASFITTTSFFFFENDTEVVLL